MILSTFVLLYSHDFLWCRGKRPEALNQILWVAQSHTEAETCVFYHSEYAGIWKDPFLFLWGLKFLTDSEVVAISCIIQLVNIFILKYFLRTSHGKDTFKKLYRTISVISGSFILATRLWWSREVWKLSQGGIANKRERWDSTRGECGFRRLWVSLAAKACWYLLSIPL